MDIPLSTLRPHDPRCTVFNTCPRYLHHYTSIETLALILSNKAIRFNRLDKVNDPREALSKEYSSAQTLVFASCWTYGDESIPHWEMYARRSGIRLSMPALMFKGRHNNHKVTTDDRFYELGVSHGGDAPPVIERRGKDFVSFHVSNVYGPTKIRYVDDAELVTANFHPARLNARYDLRTLGVQKHAGWEFEKEVRFRVLATFGYSFDSEGMTDLLLPHSFIDTPVITPHIDLALDGAAINEAEILLGPHVSAEQRKVVEDLCARYAPSAEIRPCGTQIR
jgi:hypothetical protein